VKELLDIPFSREHTDARLIDVFLPDAVAANRRCILCIHGGGWSAGGRRQWHSLARHFCEQGYVTASADYRLAPAFTFPAAIEDVRLSMAWLRARADEFGFAATRVVALGSSAGGHLVALLATIRPDDPLGLTNEAPSPETVPDAVICYCPVLDVGAWAKHSPESVKAFIGRPAEEAPDICAQASPPMRISGDEPPFLFLHGDADDTVPVAESVTMAEKLKAAGVRADVVILPGVGHGYGYGVNTPAQKESIARIARFLDDIWR
jgi:acetyl esterase/lipase